MIIMDCMLAEEKMYVLDIDEEPDFGHGNLGWYRSQNCYYDGKYDLESWQGPDLMLMELMVTHSKKEMIIE